ncbi:MULTISPECIES: hypothetical protein [unclassified Methylobacterium]|uniref:hypothetical protein n=1 Tax=unclassified Methylobacterium TaxID=2615210 RepID=UPI000152DE90|nr:MULTISPECIES: hypothetical protein [Methylobacterium]WFT82132.1 hypothetical protein QA634_09920 [Methylobacterium nodulans]
MRAASTLVSTVAILTLSAAAALAGPCTTGTTGRSGQQAGNPASSSADHSTKNLADGQQPSSAKTVGAMNNVASDRATSPADVTLQAQGKPTMAQQGRGETAANDRSSDADRSTRNTAGGQQPSSPKTVGAMNNVGANELPAGQAGQAGGGSDEGC